MKSIASINFRGGVGKSTVIWLIAKYIAEKLNKRTLVIDIDAQMNLTLAVQLDDETGLLNKEFGQWYNQHINSKKNLLNLLELYEKSSGLFDFSINSSFIYKMSDNLHFIPSTAGLYWLEIDAVDRDKIKDFVKTFLDKLEHTSRYNYDIVFFDCPPCFNSLSNSVLSTADMILMPFNPDVFAPEGINLMLEGLLQRIKPWPNPRIAAFMNKAKTIRDFYLTGDSQKYLNKVKQSKAKIEQRGIKIHVLDSFIPEKINIKSSLQKEKFPSEIEPYIQRLWNDINALLEARHE